MGEGYGWLLDETSIIAAAHDQESELGAAAFATHAVLAPLPTDPTHAVRLSRWGRIFDGGRPSVFRRAHTDNRAAGTFGRNLVLHEGYRVEPNAEGATAVGRLRSEWGGRFLTTPPSVWSSWGEKGPFRQHARTVLGRGSTPTGTTSTIDPGDWKMLAAAVGVAPHRRVVKLAGTGGTGNIVLKPGSHLGDTLPDGVRASSAGGPIVVVVEDWLPWLASLSISFLILPGSEPLLLAATEQVIDTQHAKFVGSTNCICLSSDDVDAACAHVLRLAEAMAADGVLGVSAVDIVVGTGWDDLGLPLPSGLRMCVIECNPRFNRHNRVGLLTERLARAWDLPPGQLKWALHDSPTGSTPLFQEDALSLSAPQVGEPFRATLFDAHRTMTLTVTTGSAR